MNERGSVLGETAFTFPLILLLTLGLLQGGMIGWAANAAANAARHGARMASVTQVNAASVAAHEATQAARTDFPADHSPSVQVLSPGGIPGSQITLRVTVHAPNLLSFAGGLFPGLPGGPTIPVHGDATFRQEGW